MIRQRNNIDQRFFVRMNASYCFYRLIYQLALAIHFEFVLRHFVEFANLPLEWIRAFHRAEESAYGSESNTVVIISDHAHADL